MGTTTISLRDRAYERLKREKREGESFSDVVLRLTTPEQEKRQVEELAGGLGEEFATSVEASTEAVRDELKMDSGE